MNKYARAGGGNWTDDNTWSTTSGGAADTTAPTAADDVFLDANSGNVVSNSSVSNPCRSLNCTGYTGILTMNFSISIGDATAGASNIALKLVSGMTLSGTGGGFRFISTSATVQTIDFAGKDTGNLTFEPASGGSWQFIGSHTCAADKTVTFTRGTLDINGQTCSWGKFSSNNTNTRTLTLGAANITITGTATSLDVGSTNLTLNAGTSVITTTGDTAAIFLGNTPNTWYDFVFAGPGDAQVNGDVSCRNITRTGTAVKTDGMKILQGKTVTCSGTFTLSGNSSVNRVLLYSIGLGIPVTVNAANISISNADFRDVVGAGAADWDFSGRDDIGDCGGNSGITFPASENQYFGGARLTGDYLRINGVTGDYCYIPDSAPLSITGDITIDVKVALDDWTPSVEKPLVAKYNGTGNQRSYGFNMLSNGRPHLNISPTGSSTLKTFSASTATGFTDGATKWLRVTLDVDDGAGNAVARFYTSDDGENWTQLGTDVTSSGTTSIFDSSTTLEIGSSGLGSSVMTGANFYRCRIYSDLTQTNKVFDADLSAQAAGAQSFTEDSSNAATVYITQSSGNWSTVGKWITDTGAGRIPLPQDDVYLGSAFAASQTITADMPRIGRNIDCTGATGSPTWANSVGNSIHGSINLTDIGAISGTNTSTLLGRSNHTITCGGKAFTQGLNITSVGGSYTLQDAFSCLGLTITTGTFDSNNFNVTIVNLSASGSSTKSLTMGSSVWTLSGSGTSWNLGSTNTTFSGADATIVISNISASAKTFAGAGYTYGTLKYVVSGSTGKLTITGSNTFKNLEFRDASNARTLEFTAGTTTTILNSFNVQGSASKLMTVTSATAAAHTLTKASGVVDCDYLNVSYSQAGGGASWYAGANSTNGGNNTGWLFEDAPVMAGVGGRQGLTAVKNLQNLMRL